MNSIKNIFNDLCKDFKADAKTLMKLRRYERAFVNKNENHINFFGGVLMGVHPVRFTQDDRQDWFDDLVGVDEMTIKTAIAKLDTIVHSRIVSTDTMNLSCV